jgi:simple sugar transport system ATP-binding protein
LIKERDDHKAVLLVSLEIDEILDISDRILVMFEGEIIAEMNAKDADINTLGRYMLGHRGGETS